MKKPIRKHSVAEGVLQMVDFGSLEFRIDRPSLPSITVYFEEQDREIVHSSVRQFVRVAGDSQFEHDRDEPTRIWHRASRF